jgi:hypothetical protein
MSHLWKEGTLDSTQRTRSFIPALNGDESRRQGWLRASILSGFVATFAMTVAVAIGYGIATSAGDANGNTFERWMFGLSENKLTEDVSDRFFAVMVANLVFGLVWALIYAGIFNPAVDGAGWKSGALFSLIPWVLSICVFFPIAEAGFLGIDLDAGPLPVIGNLIVHLVFGLVLGSMYGIELESGLDGSTSDLHAAMTSERGAAIGLALGGVVGAIGGWLIAPELEGLASEAVIALAGALSGGAVGTMLGSLIGMSEEVHMPQSRTPARETIRRQ